MQTQKSFFSNSLIYHLDFFVDKKIYIHVLETILFKIPRHTFFQGGVQFFSDYLDRLQSSQEVEQKIANNWFFGQKKPKRNHAKFP